MKKVKVGNRNGRTTSVIPHSNGKYPVWFSDSPEFIDADSVEFISEIKEQSEIRMLKDWFTESDDGEGGKMIMAECPNCGDAVVWNDGCIACNDYKDIDYQDALIYCDPPYSKTTKYTTGNFDSDAFWQWCRDMQARGNTVIVSEYKAPEDFKCIWSKDVKLELRTKNGREGRVEKLFILNGFEKDEARGQINLWDNAEKQPMKNEQPLCLRDVSVPKGTVCRCKKKSKHQTDSGVCVKCGLSFL